MSTHARSSAELSTLKTLSIVLAFTAAVGLVMGTAGFASIDADRGIEVGVADEEAAYLAVNQTTEAVETDTETELIEYENRFGTDLTTFDLEDVRVVDGGPDVDVTDFSGSGRLGAGETDSVNVTLQCATADPVTVTLAFDVSASGEGVSVSTTYERDVTCIPDDDPDGPTVTGVHYNNAANADINTGGQDGHVTATVWIVDSPPVDMPNAIEPVVFNESQPLDTVKKVRPEVVQSRAPRELPDDWKIVAIEFPDQNAAYVHPQWDAGAYGTPKTGDGVPFTELPLDANRLFHASVEDGKVVVGDETGGPSGILFDGISRVDTTRTAA